MKNYDLGELSSQYYDVLKEIGNIGAGNATTALAKMLGSKIDMSVPRVRLVEIRNAGEIVGGADRIMVAIYLNLEGDINGSIMFMLDKVAARHLVNKLMMQESTSEDFNEMELSALQEVGNIITGAYLNSLSQMTNLNMMPSIPYITVDMAGAILSVPAVEFGLSGDNMLLIETRLCDEISLNGYFILLPDLQGYQKILSSLGIDLQ